MIAQKLDPKSVNRHGHQVKPYYSENVKMPLFIGVTDEFGTEHIYISRNLWLKEREQVTKLKKKLMAEGKET